jgi:hypothetical protein
MPGSADIDFYVGAPEQRLSFIFMFARPRAT